MADYRDYSPLLKERGACGVGFVVDIKGNASFKASIQLLLFFIFSMESTLFIGSNTLKTEYALLTPKN